MSDRSFEFINSQAALDAFVERLPQAKSLILDTEADSFHHYFEKVCLLQFSMDDEVILVDPLCGLDLQGLMEAMAGHQLILHGADYDLRLLRAGYGFRPHAGIFDTVIAAQLLGIEAFGLSSLVERYTGVKLAKGDTRSDWSARPLSRDQLEYAVDDVLYLGVVAQTLHEELEAKGRLDWHRQACEAQIEATALDRTVDPDSVWRLKGCNKMTRRQLVFLREIWHWRDREARRLDRPAYMIMGNQPLIAFTYAAERMPASASLPSDFNLPRNVRGRLLEQLKEALEKATHLPRDEWPVDPDVDYQAWSRELAAKLKTLKNRIGKEAEALGIDTPVIASRSSLGEILRERPQTLAELQAVGRLQPWQAEIVFPHAQAVLAEDDEELPEQNDRS